MHVSCRYVTPSVEPVGVRTAPAYNNGGIGTNGGGSVAGYSGSVKDGGHSNGYGANSPNHSYVNGVSGSQAEVKCPLCPSCHPFRR